MIERRKSEMKKVVIYFLLIFCMLLVMPGNQALAKDKQDVKVLILYDLKEEDSIEQLNILDLLVGHFTKNITIYSEAKVLANKKNRY